MNDYNFISSEAGKILSSLEEKLFREWEYSPSCMTTSIKDYVVSLSERLNPDPVSPVPFNKVVTPCKNSFEYTLNVKVGESGKLIGKIVTIYNPGLVVSVTPFDFGNGAYKFEFNPGLEPSEHLYKVPEEYGSKDDGVTARIVKLYNGLFKKHMDSQTEDKKEEIIREDLRKDFLKHL